MDNKQIKTFCETAILDMEKAKYTQVSDYPKYDKYGNPTWYFAYSTMQNDPGGNKRARDNFKKILDTYYGSKKGCKEEEDIIRTVCNREEGLTDDQLKIVKAAMVLPANKQYKVRRSSTSENLG